MDVLIDLLCHNNQLTSLDVRNGNNTNVTQFIAFNNPNLLCIDVDNVDLSTENWTNIDTWASFSTNCSATSVQEHITNKELLKVIDLLGKETNNNKGFNIEIYDDGSIEKKYILE